MNDTMTTTDTEARTLKKAAEDMRLSIEAFEPREEENPEHFEELLQKLIKTFRRTVQQKEFEYNLMMGAKQFVQSIREKSKDQELSIDELKALNAKVEAAADLLDI